MSEWLNLGLRWFHVFAGILWIGQTYFFTWLDRCLTEEARAGREGRHQVWMVHSGGFYVVEKQKAPALLQTKLHWFRWEAALTWLSGLSLLILVYYTGGLMVDATSPTMSTGRATVLGIASLVAGWLVYDALWRSPLGRWEGLAVLVSFLLLVATAYGLTMVMSARASYMHVGSMLGTIMVANVWLLILPAQRRMVAAIEAGRPPDLTLAARAKQRSRHNTFMVMPVVFIMISNHFPVATYGHAWNWAILGILVLAGWAAAAIVRRG
jgi:uncharacterized membrane protein